MKNSRIWVTLLCASFLFGTACSKKDDSSSSPAAGSSGTTAPQSPALTAPIINASLKENPDGTANVDLTLPDANGVNTSHKGLIDRTRETELRSDDGKSLVGIRTFENFGILLAAQYQADRNDARLYVLAKNQNAGYDALVSSIPVERNGGLNKAMSVVSDVGQACQYSVSQSFAALAQFFKGQPGSTLDQYQQAKQQELKTNQKCQAMNLGTGPDGKPLVTWGAPQIPPPDQPGLPNSQTQPPEKQPKPILEPEPVPEQMPDLPLPPERPTPPAVQKPAPIPPVAQEQRPEPLPVIVKDKHGFHNNWQVCFDSGNWRTDGNIYCKQKWWTNCSPETGGKVCKVRGEGEEHSVRVENRKEEEEHHIEHRSDEELRGAWTQNFGACYSAGRWQTDGNRFCKKDFWPNCSPDTGGTRCRPVYENK